MNQQFKSGYRVPQLPSPNPFRRARVAILATRWNTEVVDALVTGARACLTDWGVPEKNVKEFRAPGAYEIPLAAQALLKSGKFDGVVTLGAVIRGDTPHFDFVAGEASRGLAQLQGEFGVPVGLGLLTCDTMAQAEARAGGAHGNKGWDAALAALEMADLFARLDLAHGDEGDE